MKNTRKRALSVILALAVVFGVFAALPMTASAFNVTVVIAQSDTVSKINDTIDNAMAHANSGDTVTITGAKNNADKSLLLNIKPGVTVIWEADYSGTVNAPYQMLSVTSTGTGANTFEVAAGGSINNNGTGTTLYRSGSNITTRINGTVKNTGEGRAINYYRCVGDGSFEISGTVSAKGNDNTIQLGSDTTNDDNTNITVSGGRVENTGSGHAIYSNNGNVTVNGGTVESASGNAIRALGPATKITVSGTGNVKAPRDVIRIAGADTTVNVSGGAVSSTGSGTSSAIYITDTSSNTAVNVSGGTVSSMGAVLSHAICSDGASSVINVSGGTVNSWGEYGAIHMRGTNPIVNVTGGFVFGIGTAITGEKNVIHMASGTPAITNGVVCAFNPPALAPTYTAGSSTDLTSSPAATASWGNNGVQTGISYANGANTGFFPVNGITVNEAPASSSGMSNFNKIRNYSPNQFPDVDENEWYGWYGQKFIGTAYEYGLVNGYEDGNFGPADDFTVAQAIALATRINSIYATGADLVQGEPWYQVFVDYALANGVIMPGDFPDIHRPATRAEMAYIFSRCLPDSEFAQQNTVNSLPDVNAGTPNRDSIYLLYKAGVLTGNNAQGEFTPGAGMTRAMAAGIAMRIILPGSRESGKTYG